MKQLALVLLLLSITLNAYQDFDMDGVEDKNDKCPNTLMSELVNSNGCPIENLVSYHHFDIIYGLNFYQTDYDTLEEANTISQSLQIDYYYKNFSLQVSSSYYNSNSVSYNNSGTDDSFIGAYYQKDFFNNLSFTIGVGAIIPTFNSELNNNNTDYTSSLNVSYLYKNLNLFTAYSYTIINDNDIESDGVKYRNTNAYTLGLGYYLNNKIYINSSYNASQSIYIGVEDIEVVSLYALYNIDENWFSNLTYAYGLSDSASDNFASLRVGYYF